MYTILKREKLQATVFYNCLMRTHIMPDRESPPNTYCSEAPVRGLLISDGPGTVGR